MEADWKKKFGHACPDLSPHIRELLHSKKEKSYNLALNEVRKTVRSTELQNYVFQEVHANMMRIVEYWIKSYTLYLNHLGD